MLIGVSFKLYLDRPQTRDWCAAAAEIAKRHPAVTDGDVDLVIFPTLPAMNPAMTACAGTRCAFGAQDLFWADRGAYTGAVSGADLADMGLAYAEIGHAERRRFFGENDAVIAAKVAAAVRNGLTPWLCIGEPEAGDVEAAAAFCIKQLAASLSELATPTPLVVAYEPVWAIGQSEAASAAHVAGVARALKDWLASAGYREAPVVYGGSAAPGTLTDIGPAIDGLFLGRFAHDVAAFEQIIDEAAGQR
ncbi:triose-phosphate isomerase family protein [Salinisphaera sp. Q1T1-3]|uniref:triose-phosphate isomerase n=1 Tax=Salinisphaera sp. Q1T1-3 TaxID=2321229 RepID=UPI0018F50498|nr:triose-phosphate isomerase family protein [Salinisphaera sp. Q1T1-3]